MRRLPLLALAASLLAVDAGAQIIRRPMGSRDPSAFVSLGAALQSGFGVADGTTGTVWQFGDAFIYSASLEKSVFNGAAGIGLRGSTGMVPLRYTASGGSVDADANVSQLFASAYYTGGGSLHSVVEVDLGTTVYSAFRSRGTDVRLAPTTPDADFTFVLGGGFGYTFPSGFSVDIVQSVATALHQDTGLPAGSDRSVRISSTRLQVRYALGR